MQIEEISNDSNIELEVKYSGHTMTFRSIIIAVKSNSVLVSTIKVNDQTVGFSEKCLINFLYKVEGKLFIWENVNVKLVKYEGEICHKIDLMNEGKPYNRRDSYRMYVGEDMLLYVNSASGPTAITVLVKDISETGVAFITKDEIDIERTIKLKLKDNATLITLSGVIVRREFLQNLNSFLYGCKFNEKNDKLGRYIARKQGELLRKKVSTPALSRERLNFYKSTPIS